MTSLDNSAVLTQKFMPKILATVWNRKEGSLEKAKGIIKNKTFICMTRVEFLDEVSTGCS